MSLRYNQHVTVFDVNSNTITTGVTTVVSRIDISSLETFGIQVQNDQTAIAIIGVQLQVAIDASESIGATAAPNWVRLPTASVPFPSTIEASAGAMTSAITNCYHWLRVVCGNSNTAVAGDIRVRVGGFRVKG